MDRMHDSHDHRWEDFRGGISYSAYQRPSVHHTSALSRLSSIPSDLPSTASGIENTTKENTVINPFDPFTIYSNQRNVLTTRAHD